MSVLTLMKDMNKELRQGILRKALTSAAGSGGALIPENLEKVLTNVAVRLSPEFAILETKPITGGVHSFNQVTALPGIGGAMGEASTTPTKNTTYARQTVTLKVVKRKGDVTNYLQDASSDFIDATASDMESHVESHVYDLINYCLFGNAVANPYEFSGLDTLVTTNRTSENTQGGVAITSLATLDNMIDRANRRKGNNHRRVFLMSPEMASTVSRLLTNVRLQQGIAGGLGEVDIKGGWRLQTYRNIPIIETASVTPQAAMGVVTPATAAVGGTIPDAAGGYFFIVAHETRDGEQGGCAEISQVTAGGNLSTITLTWTAIADAYRYKIYVANATGACVLRHVLPGFTYNAQGTIVGATPNLINGKTVNSDANGNVNSVIFTTNPLTAGAEVPTAMQTDRPLMISGGVYPEYIVLWDLDWFQGLGKLVYTNKGGNRFGGIINLEPLAKVDDSLPFLVKSYPALTPAFEATSVIHRNIRRA